MNAWQSKGYRALVIGGLIVCVAVPIVLAFGPYKDDPGSKVPVFAAIGVVAVYVFSIFAYQIVLLSRGGPTIEFDEPEPRKLGPADPPLGWKALSNELAVADDNTPDKQLAGRRVKGGMMKQLILAVVLMVFVIAGNIAFQAGAPAWVFAPAIVMVVVLVATVPGIMSAARASSAAWVAPLGLKVLQMPKSEVRYDVASGTQKHHVTGPMVFVGERHGRQVRIDLKSRTYDTRINGKFERFDVTADDDGRLAASDESPTGVRQLASALTPDERWRNVTVAGRPQGVTVKRKQVKAAQATQAPWIDDLWLAEAFADRATA